VQVGKTIINDQDLSLVFQVEGADGGESQEDAKPTTEDSQLEINYQLEDAGETSFLFTCPISLDLPKVHDSLGHALCLPLHTSLMHKLTASPLDRSTCTRSRWSTPKAWSWGTWCR
jgi:hypothetical protein